MHADATAGCGHVWLTGVSGAGKSTAAPLLADRLGCGFADSDHCIVAATGRTVAQIFSEEGEPAFRAIEGEIVATLAAGPAQVISLGGGALLAPENQAHILRTGVLVHLDAEPETLVERLLAGSEARPLLHASDRGQLHARVEQLRRDRRTTYALARFCIVTDGLAPRDVVEQLLQGLAATMRMAERTGPAVRRLA